MIFGNEIQINLIASEVGGAVGGAPPEAQTELFNALIAPVKLQHHETFLRRAPNLRDRVNALLEQVCHHFDHILLAMFPSPSLYMYVISNRHL